MLLEKNLKLFKQPKHTSGIPSTEKKTSHLIQTTHHKQNEIEANVAFSHLKLERANLQSM